jgi:SdrD B-like domain
MRKVLAVITAMLLAAIVFAPAMGYTFSSGAKPAYSSSSEKVNYTIGSGTVAHEMVYSEEAPENYPTYSIGSTAVPYSIGLGTAAKYSLQAGSNATKIEALGEQKPSIASENLGKGLVEPTEKENATEQATQPAQPAPQVIDLTKGNVSVNQTAPATLAPVAVKLGIKGMVKDENETGLAGWKIDLFTSDNKSIANTTSAEDGSYSFSDLTAGVYAVSEVLPADWVAVSPMDGVAGVTLTDKEVTLDFINKMNTTIAAPAATAMPVGSETNTTAQ